MKPVLLFTLFIALLASVVPAAAPAQAPAASPGAVPGAELPQEPLTLSSEKGFISLLTYAPDGSRVSFYEHTDAGPVLLDSLSPANLDGPLGVAYRLKLTAWRCDRLERRFVAIIDLPDGTRRTLTAETRTPNCRERLDVEVPRNVARGKLLRVKLTDRFAEGGFHARVCATRRGFRRLCRLVNVADSAPAYARFRTGGDAVWTIDTRFKGGKVRRVMTVGKIRRPRSATGLSRLLVTGDSLVQGIDSFLADDLQTAFDVTSDSRPGTGLVHKTATDWPSLAKSQASNLKPAVTIISLGLFDDFPIDGEPCCSAVWIQAYAQRAHDLMESYVRGGRSQVIWMLAPTPRQPRFAEIGLAVGVAVRQAAAEVPGAAVVDLTPSLAPGGVYQRSLVINGKKTEVRVEDGVHLAVAGARIAAAELTKAVRRFRPAG